MRAKRIPLRKCLGCNEMKPKKDLLRVVHNAEGVTSVDTTGRAHGRGAYICNSTQCFIKAKENKAFNKSLRANIPEHIYDDLMKEINIDEH